jgi:hypothetical protein
MGAPEKLVKYVNHSSKRERFEILNPLLTRCPNNKRLVFGFKEFLGSNVI